MSTPDTFPSPSSMIGLCGCTHTDRSGTAEMGTTMAEAAAYRGPGGVSTWTGLRASLAHLALNVTGPMSTNPSRSSRTRGIDNGFSLQPKVRRQLRTDSPTDAESILTAYRQWGKECPTHLIGDFAFAIWDQDERRLFATHGPMGMRPFPYRVDNDRLPFGSDVKQLLAAPDVPDRVLEPMAYLQNRFEPLDWTFYEDIFQLKPVHALLVHSDGSVDPWRSWDITPSEHGTVDDTLDTFLQTYSADSSPCAPISPTSSAALRRTTC